MFREPHYFLLLLLCLFSTIGSAQKLSHQQGVLLVQLNKEVNIKQWTQRWSVFKGQHSNFTIYKNIVPSLDIWQFHFDYQQINEYDFLEAIRQDRYCTAAQFNHFVQQRQTIPNDPFFASQWHHINTGANGGLIDADMDTDLAWDITTGGLTTSGDTIVVAVLDDGINLSHPDISNNLWVNDLEIPDNGLDDDTNGYVDDYHGWNITTNDDNVNGGLHGLPIAGIIGATGNNNLGISGTNWNVKIMIVKNNAITSEAEVLAAYNYPLKMRQLYNDSDGEEGAFVVVTNASWGVDFGNPDDAPLWCGMYDQLGEEGILSCGATANIDIDVDDFGDLPTTCPSDYLIAVTNVKKNDVKESAAAYGAQSVDLGAFGTDVFTIGINNDYGLFGGTSAATPQATGAVALLYSTPCPDFADFYKADPSAAALLIKQYIMDGVEPSPSLEGITVTNGRLNIFNSLQLSLDDCSPCSPPFDLAANFLSTEMAIISWITPPDGETNQLRWRQQGTSNWTLVNNVSSPFTLSGLITCQTYEIQIESICGATTSGFSNSFFFESDGCCKAPENIFITDISLNGCSINYETITAATSYNILITNTTTNETDLINTSNNSLIYNELESCSPYLIQVQVICTSGETTDYNTGTTFPTFGCGACTDLTYCPSTAASAQYEWIGNVTFNALNNSSGSDNGYGNYSGLFTEVSTYGSYPVSLTPAFSGPKYMEYFKVWIDYNQNGEFEDATELVLDPILPDSTAINGEITIPADALPGLTRMRVSMKYISSSDDEEPEACMASFGFGEVEDYCVQIVEGSAPNCDLPTDLDTFSIDFFSATINWEDATDDHINHNIRYRKLGTFNWTQINNIDPPYELTNLDFCTAYETQVAANCIGGGTSGYSPSFVFQSACFLNESSPITDNLQLSVFPNPFQQSIQVSFQLLVAVTINLTLVTTDGKAMPLLNNYKATQGENNLNMEDLSAIPAGVYWLAFSTEREVNYRKLVKMK